MKRFVAGTPVGRFSRPLYSNCRPVLLSPHAQYMCVQVCVALTPPPQGSLHQPCVGRVQARNEDLHEDWRRWRVVPIHRRTPHSLARQFHHDCVVVT
jgi:hypothetical protein